MPTESCDVPPTGPQTRYAAEWGLASLILSGFLVLAALLTLMLSLWYIAMIGQMRPGRSDARLTMLLTGILSGLFWVLTVVSSAFGVIGVRAAWRRCQPGGLPLAGLILSLFSVLLWAGVIVSLVMNIIDLSRRGVL